MLISTIRTAQGQTHYNTQLISNQIVIKLSCQSNPHFFS